jgi:PHD/YefM family antitoxin component YafN of YafNO toxin-antitoxin module
MSSSSSQDKNSVETNAHVLLGLEQESMTKTRARQQFLPLVNELTKCSKAVRITDHDEPAAVLVGYNHWSALISKLSMLSKPFAKPKKSLMGSVKILGDLEQGSKEAAALFEEAINKSIQTL